MPVDGVNGSGSNYDYEEDYETPEAGEGWNEEGSEAPDYQAYDLTRQQWIDLLNKVDARNLPTEKACLEIVRDAIRADAENDSAKESAKFQELYQALGAEADSILGLGDDTEEFEELVDSEEENQGTQPTRVEDGVNYYEAQEKGEEFSLTPGEEESENVVETDGNVTITPLDPENDEVSLSKAGSNLRVKIKHEGKLTVYTIDLKKAAHIHIASDNVQGGVDNEKGKISFGVESAENFVSDTDRSSVGKKISQSIDKIGIITYHIDEDEYETLADGGFGNVVDAMDPKATNQYAVGYKTHVGLSELYQDIHNNPSKYSDIYNEQANAAKEILTAMGKAISEKDPAKRKELGKAVSDLMDRLKTQDTSGGGMTNNIGHLILNVLIGETGGEKDLKEAIKSGLIPSDIVENLASCLEARPDESNNLDREIDGYQTGGPRWTHATAADFLKKSLEGSEASESDVPETEE